MRYVRLQMVLAVLVAAGAVLAGGCRAAPPETTYTGRAMVFNSPRLRHLLHERAGWQSGGAESVPWYADRNDHYPSVDAGHSSVSSEWTVNRTRDYQGHSGGRVRDHYWSSTTTRREVHTER